jgi:D-alanyl-D-alanine carboxypeptidase (penicillin-binding protein 5/6)
MRKATLALAAFLLAALFLPQWAWAEEFDYGHYANIGVYVMEAQTAKPLVAKNEDIAFEPASITKVLAVITAMDCLAPGDPIPFTEEIRLTVRPDSSLADLLAGEVLTFEQAIYAMLVPSGNDAARAVAAAAGRKASGNEEMGALEAMAYFAGLMNRKAAAIGMHNSRFTNADGYPEEGTYSTAKDLATLGGIALGFREVMAAAGAKSYTARTNLKTHVWSNTNLLLYPSGPIESGGQPGGANPYYEPSAIGIKTGTAGGEMGRSFLFASTKGGMTVVGALLHITKSMEETIWSAAQSAMGYAHENYQLLDLVTDGNRQVELPVSNRAVLETRKIRLVARSPVTVCVKREDAERIGFEMVANSPLADLKQNGKLKANDEILPGDVVLRGVFSLGGEAVASVDFISPEGYDKAGPGDIAALSGAALLALSIAAWIADKRRAPFRARR